MAGEPSTSTSSSTTTTTNGSASASASASTSSSPSSSSIYLDYNATTPLAPEVVSAITSSLTSCWGNPSSSYGIGRAAKEAIEVSRTQIAEMLRVDKEEIIFTSGGTEANNMVFHSVIKQFREMYGNNNNAAPTAAAAPMRPHIIITNVEHDSVAKVVQNLPDIELTVVPVNPTTGCIEFNDILSAIRPNTCLISVMHANNESGVIMPIDEIGHWIQTVQMINFGPNRPGRGRVFSNKPRIYFHTDAAQTVGKVLVNAKELAVDYLTVVGHKFYGPRIGALYVNRSPRLKIDSPPPPPPIHSLIHGGGQERGWRSGTENTPMIVGLGAAAALVSKNLASYEAGMRKVRDYFQAKLVEKLPAVTINFCEDVSVDRLPNTLSVTLPSPFTGQQVLDACAGKFDASLGAACHSHVSQVGTGTAATAGVSDTTSQRCQPSAILVASGLTDEQAERAIRFSIGRSTTLEEIEQVVDILGSKLHIEE